jgi:SAM-dependent methyltransferase
MTTGEHTTTHEACPLCQGPLRSRYDGIVDRLGTSTGTYNLDECTACGFALINPAPSGDLSAYYPDHYLSQEDAGGGDDAAGVLSRLEKVYRYNQYAFDFGLLRTAAGLDVADVSSYVDIGCGSGERVTYVAEQGCPRSVGVDRYRFGKRASRREVELVNSEVVAFRPAERFAVVSMFHVLEHVEDPVGILRHLRDHVISPDGVLVVQVPNYGAFERRVFGRRWFGLDAPRHLLQFDATTARTAVEAAGFDVVSVSRVNAPLHPVTLVPSAVPALDVQKIWVRPGSPLSKFAWQLLWAAATVVAIPFAWVQNLTRNASMLTVVARPRVVR